MHSKKKTKKNLFCVQCAWCSGKGFLQLLFSTFVGFAVECVLFATS